MMENEDLWMRRPKRVTAVNEETGETVILPGNRAIPRGFTVREEKKGGLPNGKQATDNKRR